jgi:hypothetical protein
VRNRKEGSPKADRQQTQAGSLEAKPPPLLQYIAWFRDHWRDHKLLIAIACVIVGTPAVYGAVRWWPTETKTTSLVSPDQSVKESDDHSAPALRVQFRDGSSGYVALSFSYALNPEAAARAYQNYGDQKRAVADLRQAVEGAVYRLMEPLTIDEARQHRGQIEASIIEQTKDAQLRTGHTIYQVNLKQIDQVR